MQRVVRSTFVGLVALASLTACGDKITNTTPVSQPGTNVVRSVTVTPPSATLNVGDAITLAASVNADAGVTNRTVTWSTSSATIATVDATSGAVKAVAAGSATITATSVADPTVKGAALITVGAGSNATVTISTINQTTGAGSVPANLGNVAGQLDVTLNVDPGTQKLAGVDLIMNCAAANGNSGKDTVVQTQSLASSNVAAEAAAAPITLSFNTGAFTAATGAPAFFNGACTLRAQARTSGGTTVASTTANITLNNADVVIGAITSTKTAADNAGLSWHGGDVTITTTPVFYSGRVAASTVVTFEGKQQTVSGTGTKTVTFVDGNDPANAAPAANDIEGVTDLGAVPTVTVLDAAGNNFTTNPCGNQICTTTSVLAGAPAPITTAAGGNNPFRLDTRAPQPGIFLLANNPDQGTTLNGYVGTAFRFAADSAAGYRGPNAVAGNQTRNADSTAIGGPVASAGVDKVTVVFQSGTSATGTFTTLTGTSGLAETATGNGVILRMITTDALGNADTSFAGPAPAEFRAGTVPAGARFGVDLTAPTQTLSATSTAVDHDAFSLTTANHFDFTITDNLSGTGLVYVAQSRNWNGLTGTQAAADGKTYTNTGAAGTFPSSQAVTDKSPCTIGRYNISQAASGTGAIAAFDNTGAAVGFCTPVPYNGVNTAGAGVLENAAQGVNGGYFKTTVAASDEAGNRAGTFTATAYESNSAPAVNSIDLPGSITGNSTASFPAGVTENLATSAGDITSSWVQLDYNAGGTITFQYPVTAGPGVAFDNVLTKTATVTPTVANFAKSLVVSAGPAAVVAAANNATTVRVFAADAAIIAGNGAPNAGSLAATFAPSVQLVAGSSTSFAAQFTAGFKDSLSAATPAAVSVAAGGSTTIAAVASGTTGIFNNPFAGGAVTFWYQVAGAGPWYFIASTSTGVTTDTGLGNGRSWIFSTPFTLPSASPAGVLLPAGTVLNIRAVGVNTAGDAVTTPGTAAITITP